jgi:hypothetical protein
MFRPPFRPVLVVAAVTATALLGACSDDIAAPGPTADATTTTTTTTAAPTTTTQPSAPTTPETRCPPTWPYGQVLRASRRS